MTVFLDITGAFDNLAWPALQMDRDKLGVSPHVRARVSNYLSGRTATMTIGGVSKSVRITKGCPQGSILGPTLWNVTMEALLRVEFPEHVSIQAYADDIAISVAGNTRTALVQRAEQALVPVLGWATSRGLVFSVAKSQAMMTKGYLAPGFTLAFGDERIATTDRVKYLGLWLDPHRNFKPHIEYLLTTEHALFSRLRGTMGAGWGIRRSNLLILYRGVFLPRVSYGVRFWGHATKSSKVIKKLGSLQRRALLGITGAYKTTLTATLQVLAGVPPLDLELQWLAVKEEARDLPQNLRLATMSSAFENMLDTWQARWSESSKGRWTFTCFPDIRLRISLPFALGHEVSQFLTGHGNFKAKLEELGLQPSPFCACGNGIKDVEHVIFVCPIHEPHRTHLELAAYRAGLLWPCRMEDLMSSRTTYAALVKFAKVAAYYERPPLQDG